MAIVIGVRMISFQLAIPSPNMAFANWARRAKFGHLSGMLNSILIVVLVPICGVLTQKTLRLSHGDLGS